MRLRDFNDSLHALAAAADVDAIKTLCESHCARLGFDSFVYALRVPTQFADARLILINGYPDSWVDHYFERGHYRHDPVMAYCARHLVPVAWHALAVAPGSPSERMMDEARDFGLKDGVTMPVHSAQGELGVLSFAANRPLGAGREIVREAMPFVQILAAHVHEAVRRVSGVSDDALRIQLSGREKECLRWAADGKTSAEIAQLLAMSERTVNFHLNNAMAKLDVYSRQHAIAKATLQGLIQPHPF